MENNIEQEQNTPENLEIVQENSNDTTINREEELIAKYHENFESLNPQELLEALQEIKLGVSIPKQKQFFDLASKSFRALYQAEKEKALKAFIEEGGKEEEFKYQSDSESQNSFKALFQDYKSQKTAYYKHIEETQIKNLKDKQAILEALKELIDSKESTSFQDFKPLQESWNKIGNVPSKDADTLYKNYHHHVERFFDLLNLDRELRDVEFRRNLKKKEELCEAAEALLESEDFTTSFETLQGLHRVWKEETGPVAREHRDDIWNRFQEATQKMHVKRQEIYEAQKVQMDLNFKEKLTLVDKVKTIDISSLKSHKEWQSKIDEINQLREDWKKIGRVNKAQSQESWDLFIAAIKEFNHHKNEFYKAFKAAQKDALNIKQSILEKAEKLKDSEDWKGTAEQLKKLQRDWKNSPKPYSKDADVIWEKFRAACNHFFDKRTKHFDEMIGDLKANLETKKALLEEMKQLKLGDDNKENLKLLSEYSTKWKSAGSVPREARNEIESEYRKAMDNFYGTLRLEEKEKRQIQFKMKIESMLSDENAEFKINKEKQFLRNKIDQLNKELKQYENNQMMISGGKNNPFQKEVEKLIKKHQKQIQNIKDDLKLIRQMEEA